MTYINEIAREKVKQLVKDACPPTVWDPDKGLDAFRAAIDPNGYLITDNWRVTTDGTGRLYLPDWGPYGADVVISPGQTVTLSLVAF